MNAPVNADGTKVEDAGGAHHDVQSEQDVTVDETEAPLTHHLEQNTRAETSELEPSPHFTVPFLSVFLKRYKIETQ